jgi:hypothetical protein
MANRLDRVGPELRKWSSSDEVWSRTKQASDAGSATA